MESLACRSGAGGVGCWRRSGAEIGSAEILCRVEKILDVLLGEIGTLVEALEMHEVMVGVKERRITVLRNEGIVCVCVYCGKTYG